MRQIGFGLAVLALACGPAVAAGTDDMVGKWQWEGFTIEVTKCAAEAGICAKVVAGPKNVGMEMIRSKLEPKEGAFVGRIAHPMTADIYNTKLQLTDADSWKLDGCTDQNVCATGVFKRVK
jgi:hypothetical protein